MKTIKKIILNKLTKHLLKIITEDEFFVQDKNGNFWINGKQLKPEHLELIVKEAQDLKKSFLFQTLIKEMVYVANKKIFLSSLTYDDVMGGKMILYTLDILSSKVDNISKTVIKK